MAEVVCDSGANNNDEENSEEAAVMDEQWEEFASKWENIKDVNDREQWAKALEEDDSLKTWKELGR